VKKIITFDEQTGEHLKDFEKKQKTQFLCEVPDHKMDQLRDYHDLLEVLDKHSFKEDGE
jgi:hypothetical protein